MLELIDARTFPSELEVTIEWIVENRGIRKMQLIVSEYTARIVWLTLIDIFVLVEMLRTITRLDHGLDRSLAFFMMLPPSLSLCRHPPLIFDELKGGLPLLPLGRFHHHESLRKIEQSFLARLACTGFSNEYTR